MTNKWSLVRQHVNLLSAVAFWRRTYTPRVRVQVPKTRDCRLNVNEMILEVCTDFGPHIHIDLRDVLHQAGALHNILHYSKRFRTGHNEKKFTFTANKNGSFTGITRIADNKYAFAEGLDSNITSACIQRLMNSYKRKRTHDDTARIRFSLDELCSMLPVVNETMIPNLLRKAINLSDEYHFLEPLETLDLPCRLSELKAKNLFEGVSRDRLVFLREHFFGREDHMRSLYVKRMLLVYHMVLMQILKNRATVQANKSDEDEDNDVEIVKTRTREERDIEGYNNATVLE